MKYDAFVKVVYAVLQHIRTTLTKACDFAMYIV